MSEHAADVLLYYDDVFKEHLNPPGHPERPERLDAVLKGASLAAPAPQKTPPPDVSMDDLRAVHPKAYIDEVERACEASRPFDMDTFACPGSFPAALKAAGAAVAAVEAILAGEAKAAFCAVRPPGHHAEPERAMGFCIFNNIAVAARAAVSRMGMERVLIVDWDVHHGNGTQSVFYDDPAVFYFSIHQYPHYPGSGASDETGQGDGRGYTLNVPVPPGMSASGCMQSFEQGLSRIEETGFRPDIVMISAGFDAHRDDPLSQQNLSVDDFSRMTRLVVELAERSGARGVVSVLEGGYDLDILEACVKEHVTVLSSPSG